MNKSDLIDAIADRAELSKVASGKALDAVIESIIQAVAKGDGVSLVGFGSFKASSAAVSDLCVLEPQIPSVSSPLFFWKVFTASTVSAP